MDEIKAHHADMISGQIRATAVNDLLTALGEWGVAEEAGASTETLAAHAHTARVAFSAARGARA